MLYRGFLFCSTELFKGTSRDALLRTYSNYTINRISEYYLIVSKKTDEIESPDFFQIPLGNKYNIFVYGYITNPFSLDFRLFNDGRETSSYIFNSVDINYFINKLRDLNGSFSIIRIAGDGSINIFTDRIGSRPLFYTQINGGWIISSTGGLLLPLLKAKSSIKPNFTAFTSVLLRSRPIDDLTLIKDVYRTDAGEIIDLVPWKKETKRKWFYFKYEPFNSEISRSSKLALLDQILDMSADRLSCISHNPLLLLSGGLDSRLAAVILKDKLKSIAAITLCDQYNREAKIARQVSDELKLNHRIFKRDKYYYLSNLEKYVISCLGSYFYIHAHFSKALEANPSYGDIYVGDFLEAIKKLIGFRKDLIDIIKVPRDIVNNIFSIDEYSSKLGYEALNIFSAGVRDQCLCNYLDILKKQAEEAFEVSTEIPIIIDYFLRWRRAYEISTFGMIEDIRLSRPDKNLAWDNDFISFILKLSAIDRIDAKLGVSVILKRSKNLVKKIPDANSLIPPGFSDMLIKSVKNIRKYGGNTRRWILTRFGRPPISGMHSWQNSDYLNVSDCKWQNYLKENIFNEIILNTKEFNVEFIKYSWDRYCHYDFKYSYIIYSLLNYSILMQC